MLLIAIPFAVLALIAGGIFFENYIIKDGRIENSQNIYEDGESSKYSSVAAKHKVVLFLGDEEGTLYLGWSARKSDCWVRVAENKEDIVGKSGFRGKACTLPKGKDGDELRYCIELKGLVPGKKYYYEIGDGVSYDAAGWFATPMASGNDVFAYLGDPQPDEDVSEYREWQGLIKTMLDNNPDIEFGIIGGDMVNIPTSRKQWDGFLQGCSSFGGLPLVLAPGNHEGVSSNKTYKNLFCHINNGPEGEAFYYLDYGKCRIVVLDSSFLSEERREEMGTALWKEKKHEIDTWLGNVLRCEEKGFYRKKPQWKIIVIHHPAYGMHNLFSVSDEIREEWLPIMRRNDVDIVLCGHQHLYMRTQKIDGITHIMGVSGGKRSNYYWGLNKPSYCESIYSSDSNYQIIKAYEHRLKILSYNRKGTIIDGATIIKYP